MTAVRKGGARDPIGLPAVGRAAYIFHGPFLFLTIILCAYYAPAVTPEEYRSIKEDIIEILRSKGEITFDTDGELDAAAGEAAAKMMGGACTKGECDEALYSLIVSALEARGITDRKVYPVAVISGTPAGLLEAFSGFLEEKGAGEIAQKHIGIEALTDDGKSVCVLICVNKVVELKNMSGQISKPAKYLLTGRVLKSVGNLQVVIQSPDMKFLKPTIKMNGKDFSVVLPLNGPVGCYTIEILGDIGYGPAVLNLFRTRVGMVKDEADGILLKGGPSGSPKKAKEKNRAWALFHFINGLREERGLAPLDVSGKLATLALNHCRDMKENGFFGHTSPKQGTLEDRVKKAGITSASVSEIMTLASGPEKAFENLAASPSHLSPMLGEAYTHLGVAVVETDEGRFFAAIMARF